MPEPGRCPTCGAAVRAGQPWCTQCWADLRQPAEVPAPVAAPSVPEPRGEGVTGGAPGGRGWPCSGCGELNDLALDRCRVCATPFLAAGESRPVLILPLVGDVLALSRAQRLLLAAAVAVVVSLLLVLVVVLADALL